MPALMESVFYEGTQLLNLILFRHQQRKNGKEKENHGSSAAIEGRLIPQTFGKLCEGTLTHPHREGARGGRMGQERGDTQPLQGDSGRD